LLELAGLSVASELASLSRERRKELGVMVHSRLLEIDKADSRRIRIDDGHFAIPAVDGGFRIVLPTDRETMTQTACLVLLDAKAEIVERNLLNLDSTTRLDDRFKRYLTLENATGGLLFTIEKYRQFELNAALELSSKLNKNLIIVENNDHLENAVDRVKEIVNHQLLGLREFDSRIGGSPERG
jgi:adenylate kinase